MPIGLAQAIETGQAKHFVDSSTILRYNAYLSLRMLPSKSGKRQALRMQPLLFANPPASTRTEYLWIQAALNSFPA
ncbi:MAG: hypothetical protein UD963_11295 [Christensenellales bacterium]|nr:hypothetical protein [Christensenellales bacterium]